MSGRVIAVSNRKGGTAKTTTTVNLAAALGDRGCRVLVVDLDSQGHAGLGFGVKAAPGQPTVHDVFRGIGAPLAGSIRTTAYPNIDILPADRGFEGVSASIPPLCLALALQPLAEMYQVILIDTAPTADALLVSALASAHHVLVPTTLHHLAIDGVSQFARSFFQVATTLNADLQGLSILPVQLDLRVTMQREVLEQLGTRFGRERLLAGIRSDIALAEAFGHQRPVKYFKPKTRSVEDFELLCENVIRRIISYSKK
ncbi:ParA family protein [Methylobacterium organophilum]|uniref:Sporulation initiation inhibitor protein Soj n=1 Tax=Methylobacterium organophilum TaxID=410 RepID=A0ABQ4T9I2_METOR|nr:ParA family protein [Methylobacterium organophilum]GJE27659.1 Sporulation initiation inhibitor protein Soj [Methylobacterium organophilum]